MISEALRAVVEAMVAEVARQIRDGEVNTTVTDGQTGPPTWIALEDVNPEKVARAGLAAIREPTPAVLKAMGDAWFAPGATGFWDVQTAMIDEILKETPASEGGETRG